MKKLQIASATIISVLLASNIILVNQYKHDVNEYEHKIRSQSKIIKTSQKEKLNLIDSIRSKTMEIHSLREQMDRVKMENERLNKRFNNVFGFEVTAYTSGYESTQKRKGDKGYGITTSGEMAKQNETVACPPSLEFGTKLLIQDVGLRVCQDRGNAIKTGRLDLYFDDVVTALNFGKKKLLVEILDD